MNPRLALLGLFAAIASVPAAALPPAHAAAIAPRYFSSIVWCVMENHGVRQTSQLPAERYMLSHGASFARYTATTHPSGPNYRVMVSGRTWTHAETYQRYQPTVATELAAIGIPTIDWYIGGKPDLKHDPYLDLKSPVTLKPKGPLQPDSLPPSVQVYLGYDDDDNAHDGPLSTVDRNLADLTARLDRSKWFNTPGPGGRYPVLMVTWDESYAPDNAVLTTFYGRGVKLGYVSPRHVGHYEFCRTLTDNWGLAPLGDARKARAIDDIWK